MYPTLPSSEPNSPSREPCQQQQQQHVQHQLTPDNRCCFCLTLKSGSIIVAIVNFLVNVFGFCWYATSPSVESGLSHYDNPLTHLDITVTMLFVIQVVVDAFLVFGALKQRPSYIIPWLCANSVLMGVLMVIVAFFLFFGYVRLSLDYDEYVSVLSLVGCLAGGHFFACLVVFQFRKNLLEEQSLRRRAHREAQEAAVAAIGGGGGGVGLTGLGGAAHTESAEDLEAAFASIEDGASHNYARPSSPPPAYSEAAKLPPLIREKVAAQERALRKYCDSGDESPPDYAAAVAIMAELQREEDQQDGGRSAGQQAASGKPSAPPLEDKTHP